MPTSRIILAVLITVAGCVDDIGEEGEDDVSQIEQPLKLYGFNFGIEYAHIGYAYLAPAYATPDVTWSKFDTLGFKWGDIEKTKGAYSWFATDMAIANHQINGFPNLTIWLVPYNSLYSETIPFPDKAGMDGAVATPPIHEAGWTAWSSFVTAFVERYDHDGVSDAPNLLAPIRYLEVAGSETQHEGYWQVRCPSCSVPNQSDPNYWQLRITKYLRLLRAGRAAAKAADPNVKIQFGMWLTDTFDHGPLTAKETEAFWAGLDAEYPDDTTWNGAFHEHMQFNQAVLAATDAYDAVEFHLLEHYSGIEGSIKWIRGQIAAAGGWNKEIFIGDSGSAPALLGFFRPAPYKNALHLIDVNARYILGQADPWGCHDPYAVAQWMRSEQSRFTAIAVLTAIGEGARGMNLFSPLDNAGLAAHPNVVAKSWAYQGLRDGTTAAVGPTREALSNYQWLAAKLKNVSSATRLANTKSWNGRRVIRYRFVAEGKIILAAWIDNPAVIDFGSEVPPDQLAKPFPGPTGYYKLCRMKGGPSCSAASYVKKGSLRFDAIESSPLLFVQK